EGLGHPVVEAEHRRLITGAEAEGVPQSAFDHEIVSATPGAVALGLVEIKRPRGSRSHGGLSVCEVPESSIGEYLLDLVGTLLEGLLRIVRAAEDDQEVVPVLL